MHTISGHKESTGPQPRVTVFMPAYNAERYIAEAIESVLAQTFTDFELIVIDDASTDNTPAVIRGFAADGRLRVITHTTNCGRPRTRNRGLELANGDYIAFLDADDRCSARRLSEQVAYLDGHPDIDGVGSWKACIDSQGNPAPEGVRRYPLQADDIACRMLVECPLAQTALMVRRRAFSDYRYDNEFLVAQDYELWARMIRTCRFANASELLTSYRQHEAQISSTANDKQKIQSLKIYGRQAERLGVRYEWDDLVRHERLFKFSSRESVFEHTGAPLDIHYLRWARRWLEALREGNAHSAIYPEPALSRMLAARWLFAARKAIRNSGLWLVTRELARSSLTAIAVAHPMLLIESRREKRGKQRGQQSVVQDD